MLNFEELHTKSLSAWLRQGGNIDGKVRVIRTLLCLTVCPETHG